MKGLIIAAGYGTRFLPVTKTVPKEILPLITKPSISFIVEEFLQAGIREIVIVSSRRKRAIEDFFDREVELEELFTREGASEKLEAIAPYNAHFSFVRQQKMMGTGDALLQAEPL
ncbi:MAG: sugar phosphate nucleotidyltransferase, partial [Sediminispirochaetaceae bacterium]